MARTRITLVLPDMHTKGVPFRSPVRCAVVAYTSASRQQVRRGVQNRRFAESLLRQGFFGLLVAQEWGGIACISRLQRGQTRLSPHKEKCRQCGAASQDAASAASKRNRAEARSCAARNVGKDVRTYAAHCPQIVGRSHRERRRRPPPEKARETALNQRMGRDSNPRWTLAHSGFQDRRLRPLGHPSQVHKLEAGRTHDEHGMSRPCGELYR